MKKTFKSKFKFTVLTPLILVGLVVLVYVAVYILRVFKILPCEDVSVCTDEGLFIIFAVLNSVFISILGLIIGGCVDIYYAKKKSKFSMYEKGQMRV